MTVTGSRSISNTHSSTVGVDVEGLSAAVGFDVTRTKTWMVSASYVVPRGKYGTLRAHPLYNRKSFKAYWKVGGGYAGKGIAYQVIGICYTHSAR
ncbi:hypothetical protein [Actinoallomurus sp. NPDC050550]|uniref:hypothetical protein n=1 Tax=Actinoallomurus sp. NPDC050550 TaxID=3154937 RepID=UPI003400E9C0